SASSRARPDAPPAPAPRLPRYSCNRGGRPNLQLRYAVSGRFFVILRARTQFTVPCTHSPEASMEQFHGTTILSVRRGNNVALGGDGQVTLGNVVMKGTARKVRKVYNGKVLVGFAGGTADAFTLLERFEAKLEKHQGNLMRASVELAKD